MTFCHPADLAELHSVRLRRLAPRAWKKPSPQLRWTMPMVPA